MTTVIQLPKAYGHSIFCDDIRLETGNKVSFMGVYNNGIALHSALPVTLPKFCIWVTYFERALENVTGNLKVAVYLPGDEEANPTAQTEIPFARPDVPEHLLSGPAPLGAEPVRRLDFPIQLAPLVVKQEGIIRVRMFVGDEMVKVGALAVTVKPRSEDAATAISVDAGL